MFGLSSYFAGDLMNYISPQMLTVISGVLSAGAGIVWFARSAKFQFAVSAATPPKDA